MNIPKNLLTSNSKLKRDGIWSFGIPAYKSETGLITCPGALHCIKGCYARNGLYTMPSVKKAQEARLRLTFDRELFIALIDREIAKKKVKLLRIHDSGDFYSAEYRDTWLKIVFYNPHVVFYAYTKNLPLFKGIELPRNFTLIYSEGGKHDAEINRERERHSRVFESQAELQGAGYQDTSTNDLNALGSNHRIGLIYHGAKTKTWKTAS